MRLPRNGERCPHSGFSRSALNELILPNKRNGFAPPVKSISHRTSPHQVRGVRLILYSSLMAYLESQFDEETVEELGDL